MSVLLGAVAAVLVTAGLFLAGGAWRGTDPSPPQDRPPATQAAVHQQEPEPSTPTSADPPAAGLRPTLVVVPALGVRAPVIGIRTEDGALTPPPDPQDVGWWSGGSRPGASTGAAVITGHTVHTGGGVFDDLETLSRGDRVVVGSPDGAVAYRVASVEVLGRDELARRSRSLFSRSGPGRLVLITCEDWDGTAYRSNVVVTARPSP
jgi:LPXTG-site transpeptidase (sortase) family protein